MLGKMALVRTREAQFMTVPGVVRFQAYAEGEGWGWYINLGPLTRDI
jgi:hypothetical protein